MYDVFSIFEFELGLETGTFCVEVEKNPEEISEALKSTGLYAQVMPLAQDLYQKGSSAPLLTQGTDLWQNIDALVRIVSRNSGAIESPKIRATEKVTIYLKSKIMRHVESIKENLLASTPYRPIFDTAQKREDLKQILNSLGEIVDTYLTMPGIITALITAMQSKASRSILEKSVNAAYISMFTFKNRKGFQHVPGSRACLIEIGSAALFSDIGRIVYGEMFAATDTVQHPPKSAEVAESLGLNPDVVFAIRNHHLIKSANGEATPPSDLSRLYKDIIVVVDLFISLIAEAGYNENEIIIGLYNLARSGYLDLASVKALGDIYVGRDKSRLIADGIRLINEECDDPAKEAYVWNPNAPVPYSIICSHQACREIGAFTVETYTAIDSDLNLGMVPKGQYRHCKKLTQALLQGGSTLIGATLVTELCNRLDLQLAPAASGRS